MEEKKTPILGPLVSILSSQKFVIMALAITGAFIAWMLGKITVEQFGAFAAVTLPAWLISHGIQDGLKAKAPMVLLFIGASLVLPNVACAANDGFKMVEDRGKAQALATAANALLPILIDAMEQEGNIAIDKASSRQEAEDALAAIEKSWEPIWEKWKLLVVAQDAWARTIEGGGDTTEALAALKKAYCGLMAIYPKSIPAAPIGLVTCEAA